MMIGTRQWICETEQILENSNNEEIKSSSNSVMNLHGILQQGKKISQIIAYIWLNQDENAQKLDEYFKGGNKERVLSKLLFADNPETDEYKLLLEIFEEKYLPIFSKADQEFIKFRVATNTFEGSFNDPGPSDNGLFIVTIPYPPCPNIYDDIGTDDKTKVEKFTIIKRSELKEWLAESPNKPPYSYEKNPFIPATSS